MSWYSLLAGVGLFPGVFPGDRETRLPTAQEAKYDMAEVDSLLERSAMDFPDHREFLKAIQPKPDKPSPQVYFW